MHIDHQREYELARDGVVAVATGTDVTNKELQEIADDCYRHSETDPDQGRAAQFQTLGTLFRKIVEERELADYVEANYEPDLEPTESERRYGLDAVAAADAANEEAKDER